MTLPLLTLPMLTLPMLTLPTLTLPMLTLPLLTLPTLTMPKLTMYTRAACHLCDEALAALEGVRTTHPFELEVIDLDGPAGADKRTSYDWEVPVVEFEGRKIMKYRVDTARLMRLLEARR